MVMLRCYLSSTQGACNSNEGRAAATRLTLVVTTFAVLEVYNLFDAVARKMEMNTTSLLLIVSAPHCSNSSSTIFLSASLQPFLTNRKSGDPPAAKDLLLYFEVFAT